jgi:hypothetical protein
MSNLYSQTYELWVPSKLFDLAKQNIELGWKVEENCGLNRVIIIVSL